MALPNVEEISERDRVLEVEEPETANDPDKGQLPEGWDRAETSENVPYYISHVDGQTHWDHPDMMELKEKFEDFNQIKYAAYRTAMKLRAIQTFIHMSRIKLSIIRDTLDHHGLTVTHNSSVISVIEMEAILVTMFNQVNVTWSKSNRDHCAELCLNWILNCYDSGRTGKVNVMQFKLALAVLCSASLEDKYVYMFGQICSQGRSVNKAILTNFVKDIILIPQQLGEHSSFLEEQIDIDADAAATNCLQFSQRTIHQGVGSNDFVSWMLGEPRFIVWLPTMHRLAASETVKHEAKCGVCKRYPIVGMRFRSLKDFSTDFCQACYFTQKTTKNHKLIHPVREYCLATTTGDDVKDFAKVVRNKFSKRRRHKRKYSYNNYHYRGSGGIEKETVTESPLQSVHNRIHQLAERLANDETDESPEGPMVYTARDNLNAKILALEEENRQLSKEMAMLRTTSPTNKEDTEELSTRLEILQEYARQLEKEIEQLREMLHQQYQQPLVVAASSSVSSARDLITIGSEETDIDALMKLMMEAFPTGQEPGMAVYIHEELYQKMMSVSDTTAGLTQDVITCYTPHT